MSRSNSQTPSDFFLWGYVTGLVYVPPLPANFEELKMRITVVLETVTNDMLQGVSQEFNYQLDVCRVTGGAHIKHLSDRS